MAQDDKSLGTKPPVIGRRPPWVFLILVLAVALMWIFGKGATGRAIPYSEFREHLANDRIAECQLTRTLINGKLKEQDLAEGESPAFHAIRVEDPDLIKELTAKKVEFTGQAESSWTEWLWLLMLPMLFLIVLLPGLLARVGSPGAAALRFGASKAKLQANLDTGVTFGDVAGCDEAKQDLAEVVEFLGQPERFVRLGAKIPKGLLLVGPPGTGKTLLARAVAGEAGVPFYSLSGSDFVEMFVGVGASRVRDLFEQAKKQAPCIVFIDEIDAIGRTRGVHLGSVNDEREQTLNQLLVELDGFEANNGVILLAATNRPDVLDRALMRPGRFDRQVVLDVPDVEGRRAILEVHARGKPLADDVDLVAVARGTPGFAGADLANALNEAALLAARRSADCISQHDIEAAIEKVIAGPERKSRRMRDEEKRRVAYHETGHALVALRSEHADPVHKISIVPRGRAVLGYTLQLPAEDQMMATRSELLDKIRGLLGGYAAEQLVFDEPSTGAGNDLERATTLARQMVCLYGMGEAAGLMHCAHEGVVTRIGMEGLLQRDCSEETAREIDKEVKQILAAAMDDAAAILEKDRTALDRIATALLERETLDGATFRQLVEAPAN